MSTRPPTKTLQEVADVIIRAFKNGNKVLICGNGGSAEMASHMAGEFVGKFEHDRKALPALALTTDPGVITAIGNDFGFEYVFARQIEAHGNPGDILITFSTSGTSKNVLEALLVAHAFDLLVIEAPRDGNGTADIQEKQFHWLHDVCREVEKAFL